MKPKQDIVEIKPNSVVGENIFSAREISKIKNIVDPIIKNNDWKNN